MVLSIAFGIILAFCLIMLTIGFLKGYNDEANKSGFEVADEWKRKHHS